MALRHRTRKRADRTKVNLLASRTRALAEANLARASPTRAKARNLKRVPAEADHLEKVPIRNVGRMQALLSRNDGVLKLRSEVDLAVGAVLHHDGS